MTKKGELVLVRNVFMKKGEISVRTIISLVLTLVFFALIAYLFIQKFPAP